MPILAEPILKKQFRSLTSKDKVKKVLQEDLVKHIKVDFVPELTKDIEVAFDLWNNEGGKKDKLKDLLANNIAKRKTFKFTQGTLDKIIDLLLEQALTLKIEKLDVNSDSKEYADFLATTLEDTARVLEAGITDQPCWALYFIQGDSRALATPLIQLSDRFLWIPSLPSEGILEDGTNFTRADIFRFFQPIIDQGFASKKDRGSVEAIGPRGGRFLCGEVYSSVPRADLKDKDKTIPLNNGYSLELFITPTPPTPVKEKK